MGYTTFEPGVVGDSSTIAGSEVLCRYDEPYARVIARAWIDEDYRRALLATPGVAIEEETGVVLPKGVRVEIHEETPNVVHLVLPQRPVFAVWDPDRVLKEHETSRMSSKSGSCTVTCAAADGF